MKRLISVLALLLLAGCSDTAQKPGDAESAIEHAVKIAELEARIKELESEVVYLQDTQSALEGRVKSNIVINASIDGTNTAEISLSTIKEMLNAALEENIGTPTQIQSIFQEAVLSEMAAYEQRIQLEKEQEEEEAKQRRAEREKQREEERQAREARKFETYATMLNINQDEYQKLREIEDNTRSSMRETMRTMYKDGGYTPKNYQEAMGFIREQHNNSVKEVLDDTQFKTYQEQNDSIWSHMGFGGGRRHGRGRN
ncbi:hypothetical protein BVX97_02435 [bacterium E08(2017)]|nr:hypothetical protein BVX97_02435 [bacterium E08(2017)]